KLIRDEKNAFLFENENEDVRVLAWTTTPWTLPSNTALAVGPKIDYVKVKTTNVYTQDKVSVIMADALVPKWMGGKKQPEIEQKSDSFKGVDLIDSRYEQLLAYGNEIEPLNGKTDAFKIVGGNFVTTEDGTGIVHTAPSFGADDRRAGLENGIGALTLVDKQGKFIDSVGEFSNRYVKNYKDDPDFVSVDVDIAVHLKLNNQALNVAKYEHNYPHCWRTDKPVLYYPLDSWFVKTSSLKERMFELNQTINWKPASTGTGRFGKWLENLQDWNLSRSRFWGIPLPIWRSLDAEGNTIEETCVNSIEHLEIEVKKANEKLGLNQQVPEDLHRPYIDEVILADSQGNEMRRELDLIDVWFDSGSMPYAQWHYPFENKEKFQSQFPADFIAEGVDQTRGWFYTLHAIATLVFDSVAYKNVVSNGLVLDKNGQKMSKRLGNAVDPFMALDKYGADANRWYMIYNSPPWDNLKYDLEGVKEVRNKFFGTLYNTYSFFSLYANIDKFLYAENPTALEKRPEIDRWIISKLNSLIKDVDAAYGDYEATQATRAISDFVQDQLSNWYVRLCRRRFWKGEYSDDKIQAYQTLYDCMVTVAKLISPVAPFFADWLYNNLNMHTGREEHQSVHLADFPKANEAAIDKDLEERMDYAQRISSLVLSLRKKENHRVRQPLQKILLPVLNETFESQVKAVNDLILAETNIKEIQYVKDTEGLVKKSIKPNFKTLGRKLGKNMKAAAAAIGAMGEAEIKDVESKGVYTLALNGDSYELDLEDFVISSADIPGWTVANDGPLTVALDTTLNDVLLAEGMAKELINRIQNIRKDSGLEVTDRIEVIIDDHEAVRPAVEQFGDMIKAEVLAEGISLGDASGGTEVELPGELCLRIKVAKI
ncbi:MAG: isoleucine--tRNA ligase, partial [Saprospiraceae bacterium]|nr:isoleucine--tRNA ligase [Saprospiraceae bacterium]